MFAYRINIKHIIKNKTEHKQTKNKTQKQNKNKQKIK